MFRLPLILVTLVLPVVISAPGKSAGPPPPPKDGEQLISQMRERYFGKWYKTLTFVQKTTLPDRKIETWYEALELPGKLRIDVAPLDSMKTLLFRNDSLYVFDQGKLKRSQPLVHPLMVLGFDVYQTLVSQTVQKLRKLKFDLSRLHQTTWQGRPTYVVGAQPGDTTSPQFWIDAERLYFVRSLEPSKQDPSVINDTRFDRYIRLGGGWLEMEVLFLSNGQQKMKEEYSNPKADVKLDPGIFDPEEWTAPRWIDQDEAARR
ncbi:MAG: LolA family protein [Gemmatimonadales bacterium]